jgi:hypothetical protein
MTQITTLPDDVICGFKLYGSYLESRPYGGGHINDTLVAAFSQAGTRIRYIFQRINQSVFKDPVKLMENISRVTEEQHRQLVDAGVPDVSRRALRVIPAKDGRPFLQDSQGGYWRCYLFIEGARSYDVIENPHQAYEAAKAFGAFQELVTHLPGPRLNETIPDFHNTRSRFERLRHVATTAYFRVDGSSSVATANGDWSFGGERPAMVATEGTRCLSTAAEEWSFIRDREEMVDVLHDLQKKGVIPERVTHNDTKLNNVMIDDATQTGICVIDLDTVMPGLALYDFGDLVRTATSPVAEDETDVAKVRLQMPMFEALVKGYLSSAHAFLTDAEKENLVFSGKLIALETGIRFLTDYLEGDVYFKTSHSRHNLDRCRTQLALVRSIEKQESEMKKMVDRA